MGEEEEEQEEMPLQMQVVRLLQRKKKNHRKNRHLLLEVDCLEMMDHRMRVHRKPEMYGSHRNGFYCHCHFGRGIQCKKHKTRRRFMCSAVLYLYPNSDLTLSQCH